MRILHVIDALDDDGSARQLRLLAPALAQVGCGMDICCLGPSSRAADALGSAGVAVHVLGWTRWLDAPALWRLRGLVRDVGHNLIHVWRLAALRAVAVVAPAALPRVIVSSPLPRTGRLHWWDRQVLRRVRFVAQPAAVVPNHTPAPAAWTGRYPRRIACAGRLDRGRGFREAIWAVDVLRYVLPDVHLLIAGTGPGAADLQEMIERLDIANAHLLGDAIEPAEVLGAADVCWVPSRADRGRQTALEAMALGKPVIASDVPCLRSLIRDGETGCLVPPGDPVALARQTLALLRDRARCARLGAAARADALARFGLDQIALHWHGLYNHLAA